MRRYALLVLLGFMLAVSTACGGGGGSTATTTSATVQTSTPAVLTITTRPSLPGALQGSPYSTALAATGGTGTLHWSIAAPSAAFTTNTGLSLDGTGVLSGTANFQGTQGFTAQVADSGTPPQLVTAFFFVSAFGKLTAGAIPPVDMFQFQNFASFQITSAIQGGVPPLFFSLSSGSFPPGVHLQSNGNLQGGPYATGNYQVTLIVQDSFSPPEALSIPATVTVSPANLTVFNSLPPTVLLNRPFSALVVARGGTAPYTFSGNLACGPSCGSLPPGLSGPDPVTGTVFGTPTKLGSYNFSVMVTDSSSPPQTSFVFLTMVVNQPLGRNDTPASATKIANGLPNASISPYVDPPNGTPTPGDGDYYKLVGLPGAIVNTRTFARIFNNQNPVDTVIEIVDTNGARLNTCRLPGDSSNTFASPCINDDISANNTDSALDFQVPVNATPALTFLVHVLDFRGDARPDMRYGLLVSGAVDPVAIQAFFVPNGQVGNQFNYQVLTQGGVSPFSWSFVSGNLPPGITLNAAGLLSGTPTTAGSYMFTIGVSDFLGQTATAQLTIQVF